MNTRLQKFLAAENITQSQFADTIGVARAGVSHVIAGRNKPGYDFMASTMQNFPNLNIEWLMFGKGKMYKEQRPTLFDPASQFESTAQDDAEEVIDIFPVHEEESNMPIVEEEKKTEVPIDTKPLINQIQSSNNQRRVSKVVVLFDDGSFQEL